MLKQVYCFLENNGRLVDLCAKFNLTHEAPIADRVRLKDVAGNSFCLRYFEGGRVAFPVCDRFAVEVDAWLQANGPCTATQLRDAMDVYCVKYVGEVATFVNPDHGLVRVHMEGKLCIREEMEWQTRDEQRQMFIEELGNMYDVPAPLPEPDWEVGDFGAMWAERFFSHHFGKIAEGYGRRDAEEVRSLIEACSPEDVRLLCKFITRANWRELA